MAADAAALPFKDNSFDAISIGFAFRNLTFANARKDLFLKEILRVLHPGGRFVIVESAQPGSRLVRFGFRIYLTVMVAWLGGILSGHRKAYQYLAWSAANFYSMDELKKMLLDAGFSSIQQKSFFPGTAGLHVCSK